MYVHENRLYSRTVKYGRTGQGRQTRKKNNNNSVLTADIATEHKDHTQYRENTHTHTLTHNPTTVSSASTKGGACNARKSPKKHAPAPLP